MPPKVEAKTEQQMNKLAEKKAKAAEKKERKRLEAEERAKFLKKQHLRREIELGARNVMRFQQSWREMVMKMKMPTIKKDLEVAWHSFDRALDIKDYSISLLLDALEKAEEQYQMNFRSHTEYIDRFKDIYKMRLATQGNNYQRNLDELLIEAQSETDKINYQYTEEDVFLRVMIFSMKKGIEESLNNLKSMIFTKLESRTEDYNILRRMEVTYMSKNIRLLWKNLQNVVSDYMTHLLTNLETKDRRQDYEILKQKDDTERDIINQQLVRTATLFEEMRILKEKIPQYKSLTGNEIITIEKERNFFQESYCAIKNGFIEEQTVDKNQFRMMAVEYNKTIQYLSKLVKKLENILTLMQICRKYETQEEKIVPFPIQMEEHDIEEVLHSSASIKNCEVLNNIKKMENFWRRAGVAQMTSMELKHEGNKLKEESKFLRQCLKFYIYERVTEQIPRTINLHAEG